MASKQTTSLRDCSKENTLFVRRFIYDVLVYTLRKCGFPETSLPTTELEENVYPEPDLVRSAGASVLRTALVMRDKWRQMFTSRLNSRGFTTDEVPDFLSKLAICCPQSQRNHTKSMIQLYLASSNEIIMYFDLKKVDVDLNVLMNSISLYIYGMMVLNRDDCETIEDLFDDIDDLTEYIEWLIDFITEFALPYGFRDDVSDHFFKRIRERFQDQVAELVNSHRFLPFDLFSLLSDKEWEDSPQPTSATKDGESAGPSKLPAGSEAQAPKRKSKRPSTESENLPEHSGQSSKMLSALGIEPEMDKMCLGAEGTSQETHGAKPKHKTTPSKGIGSCPFLAEFSGAQ